LSKLTLNASILIAAWSTQIIFYYIIFFTLTNNTICVRFMMTNITLFISVTIHYVVFDQHYFIIFF